MSDKEAWKKYSVKLLIIVSKTSKTSMNKFTTKCVIHMHIESDKAFCLLFFINTHVCMNKTGKPHRELDYYLCGNLLSNIFYMKKRIHRLMTIHMIRNICSWWYTWKCVLDYLWHELWHIIIVIRATDVVDDCHVLHRYFIDSPGSIVKDVLQKIEIPMPSVTISS
jgi:hypothetical protein